MVLLYTWVHGMVFCVIGGIASKLLALAERNRSRVRYFAVRGFEFGFVCGFYLRGTYFTH
jgi:hypothetical protein